MGRKRSANSNLPDRMLARKRTRKNGKTTVYYYYDGREDGRRKEIPLGTDYIAAVQEWSKLEAAKLPKSARVTFPVAAERYLQNIISHRSRNTISSANNAVRKLSKFFGGENPAPRLPHCMQLLRGRLHRVRRPPHPRQCRKEDLFPRRRRLSQHRTSRH